MDSEETAYPSHFIAEPRFKRVRVFTTLRSNLCPREARESANYDVEHAVPNQCQHLAGEDPLIL